MKSRRTQYRANGVSENGRDSSSWVKISALFIGLNFFSPHAFGESIEEMLEPLIRPYIEAEAVVGLSIGAVRGDERFTKGYGRFSKDNPSAPDSKTIYEIGSISKVFTGILLADAVVAGKLPLDQSIHHLLPDDAKLQPYRSREKDAKEMPISLQHLSTHASGLPRLPGNLKFSNADNPYADYSLEDLKTFLRSHRLRREPMKKGEYSNLGVGLLGWLLAEQSKEDYATLLREKITEPLSMDDTMIEIPKEKLSQFATPYTLDGKATLPWDLPTLVGAGGIRSCVDDMLKFVQANLAPPEEQLGKAIELAWKKQQEPIGKGDFAMGLGWMIARDGHTHWHTGGTGGFHSAMFVDRRSKTGVVLLANTSNPEVDELAESLTKRLFGMEVEPRKFPAEFKVAPELVQRYAGKYELAPKAIFTVRADGDKLWVTLSGQPEFRVFPESETKWRYKVVDAVLTFELDDKSNCVALDLFQGGQHHNAKRIDE